MSQNNSEEPYLLSVFKNIVQFFDSKSGKTGLFVAMALIIVYQNREINKLQASRFDDSEKRRESEVAIYQKLVDRFDPEMKKMKGMVDSSTVKVDSTIGQLTPILNNISTSLDSKNKK